MKATTAAAKTAIDRPYVAPVRLLTIVLPGKTMYLCDRVFGAPGSWCVHNGQVYEPLILEWQTIESGRINLPDETLDPAGCQVTVDNTTPVGGASTLAALFATYAPHFAAAAVVELYDPALAAADAVPLIAGSVEDVLDMDAPHLTIVLTGLSAELTRAFSVETVDTSVFPDAAPADIGKMLPKVYGTARRVPLIALDVGVVTTLVADLAAGSTDDIILSDDIDRLASAGTLQAGEEKIAYTSKNNSTKTVSGITRGASGTESAEHSAGDVVGEVKSEYVYALGCPAKAINGVYVAGVLQDPAEYTIYTGHNGDDHATYAGRCVVVFTSLSVIKTAIPENADYAIAREATNLPIGGITAVDKNGVCAGFDETTAITLPAEPSGTLSDITAEYHFDINFFHLPGVSTWDMANMPAAGFDFYIDGVLVANLGPDAAGTAPELTVFLSSPITVSKTAWPTTAAKTKTFRHADYGTVSLVVTRAIVSCESTVSEADQMGRQISRAAENLPCGGLISRTAVDDADALTFPAAPSGTLSGIYISISWAWASTGEAITNDKPRMYEIGGLPVYHVAKDATHGPADSTANAILPQTIYLPQTSWQTEISKTVSRMAEWNRSETFVITAAEQVAFTDDISGSHISGIVNGTVCADVDGYPDDASGTITGTPNALIERPDHILKHILTVNCSQAAAICDATAYTAAGAVYVTNSYALGFAIVQAPDVPALLARIAYQSRSVQWWSGGAHHIKYIPAAGETAVKTITAHRIDLAQLWIKYTDRADIANTLTATYSHAWNNEDNQDDAQATVAATIAASVTKYGTLARSTSYPYITAEAQAQDVIDREAGNRSDVRLVIELAGGYWLADLEQGDVVNFDFDAGDVLDQALLGRVTALTDLFRVIDRTDRPDATKQIQLVAL